MSSVQEKMFGRTTELEQITNIIQGRAPLAFICIHGPGGIGKTTLLRATREWLEDKGTVVSTDILNFDDLRLRVAQNVPRTLAQQLGGPDPEQVFPTYLKNYKHLQKMQETDRFVIDQVQEQVEKTTQAFLAEYCELARQKRVVILLDTVEKVQDSALWQYVVVLLLQLPNTVVVLAGRENDRVHHELQMRLQPPAQSHLLELEVLHLDDAREYFQRTELGRNIYRDEPDLAERICRLIRLPILIDLTVDWLRENRPLPELLQKSPIDLDEETIKKLRPGFEEALVEVLNPADPTHEAILFMAHVYHSFNGKILAHLKGSEEKECAELLENLKQFSFIKLQPDGGMTLHDEMQRLITTKAWPTEDPSGKMRCDLSSKMVEYLGMELSERPDDPIFQQATAAQQLYHQLYVNADDGYERFNTLFRGAFEKHQTDFCSMLLEFVRALEKNLPEEKLPKDKAAWLDIATGSLAIKQNDLKAALDYTQKGVESLKGLKITKEMDSAYNSLGYCHRLRGNWKAATDNYEKALDFAKQERDAAQIAETMNNIANVCRLGGDYEVGLRYTKLGLKIRESQYRRLERKKEKGEEDRGREEKVARGYANSRYMQGLIMWEIGNVAEATGYLEEAKKLYEGLDDQVRIAQVERQLGYFHYCIGNMGTAMKYLDSAVEKLGNQNVKSQLADALNLRSQVRRRSVYEDTEEETLNEDFQKAAGDAYEGLKIARQIEDRYLIAQCNLTLCILYYRWGGEYYRTGGKPRVKAPEHYKTSQEHYDEGAPIAEEGNYFNLLSAYHMIAGNVAYDEGLWAWGNKNLHGANQKWDSAFKYYLDECQVSARYKALRFDRALGALAAHLLRLPTPELTQEQCNELIRQWKQRGMDQHYPQLIEECEQIKRFLKTPEEPLVSHFSQLQADLLAQGHWERVIQAGEQVMERNRVYQYDLNTVQALNRNAFALRQLGRFSEARRLCTLSTHLGTKLLDGFSDNKSQMFKLIQAAVAETYFTMGQINWITGNTAQAKPELDRARKSFDAAQNRAGIAKVDSYEGFLHFRVNDFEKAEELLKRALDYFKQVEQPEYGQLADWADTLVLQGRLLQAQAEKREGEERKSAYDDAEQAMKKANEIAHRVGNHYAIAESLLNLYLRNRQKGKEAQDMDPREAARYFDFAQQFFDEGYKVADQFVYDLLSSVFDRYAADDAFAEKKWDLAFEHYVVALECGARAGFARLHRTLDPCIDSIVKLPADMIRYYADYIIREWKAKELDTKFPDVVNTFELIKEYRDYVAQT